jgi:hypothetical protein
VSGDRRLHVLSLLEGSADGAVTMRLAAVAAQVTGSTGGGIMLMSGDIPRGSVCATDDVSALIEQVQYELGEGPCVDAWRMDEPVAEPDLLHPVDPRWLAFSPRASASGARAVFGFPLSVGGVRLGALNLYRDRPGPLSDDEHAYGIVTARIAAETVLLLQAGAPDGQVAAELDEASNFQYVVHQASGMVAAQLDCTVALALIRLRAHAFGSERPLGEVARDVVERRLRFDADTGGTHRVV